MVSGVSLDSSPRSSSPMPETDLPWTGGQHVVLYDRGSAMSSSFLLRRLFLRSEALVGFDQRVLPGRNTLNAWPVLDGVESHFVV
jgi:hypothetical protein